MRSLRALSWFACLLVLVPLSACMGSHGTTAITGGNANPTSVLFTQAPQSMGVGSTALIDASAIYPLSDGIGMNAAVSYAVACGSTNCGTLAPAQMVGEVSYTAPQTIPTGGTVTITATSQQDSAISAKAVITITPPPPPTLTFVAPVQGTVQVNAQAQFAVSIQGDSSATPQANWTVSCGGPECGSVTPSVTGSGQMMTYTAPATVPAGQVVTLTATSVADPAVTVATTVAIVPAPTALANGSYVFQIQAQEGQEYATLPVVDAGVFTAANGTVTGGEEDLLVLSSCANGYGGGCPSAQSSEHRIIGGGYAANADGSTTITLQLDSGTTESVTGVIRSSGQGFPAQIDGIPALVSLWQQTGAAAPRGGYALTLSGQSNGQGEAWMTGVLNIDGTNQASGNGSVLDIQSSGLFFGGEYALAATAVTAPDSAGRIVFALLPAAQDSNPFQPVYVVGYIIDSGHIALIETGNQTDNVNFQGMLIGEAISQGAQTGTFTAAALANQSYVFGALGEPNGTANELAGVLTFNPSGGVTGQMTISDLTGSQQSQPLIVTGNYTVQADGRVLVTNLTNNSILPYSMVLDLAENGRAMVLMYYGGDIAAGEAYQRSSSTFSVTSWNGNFGINVNQIYNDPHLPGIVQTSSLGSLEATPANGTVGIGGFLHPVLPQATAGSGASGSVVVGSFTPATDGVLSGTLTGLNVMSPTLGGQFTVYQIDAAHALVIEDDSVQETLGLLEAEP